jgi:hypothetical protein
MKNEADILKQLESHRVKAPDGFTQRVMAALPDRPKLTLRDRCADFWPAHGRWITPAFAGAMAALLVVFGLALFKPAAETSQVTFHFELHAPGADRVELLGTFNNWKSGDIVLAGPDASGHWTAEVALPEGRQEYIFLVDGERWVADPKAATQRPDGFGRVNTIITVYDDEDAIHG